MTLTQRSLEVTGGYKRSKKINEDENLVNSHIDQSFYVHTQTIPRINLRSEKFTSEVIRSHRRSEVNQIKIIRTWLWLIRSVFFTCIIIGYQEITQNFKNHTGDHWRSLQVKIGQNIINDHRKPNLYKNAQKRLRNNKGYNIQTPKLI